MNEARSVIREGGRGLAIAVLVLTLAPIAALAFGAHERAVARALEERLVVGVEDRALQPGDIVAANGRLAGEPVHPPFPHPQFVKAAQIVARVEVRRWNWHLGELPKWQTTSGEYWVSPWLALGGWTLDRRLFEMAPFNWYRPSPCEDYPVSSGWVTECPEPYLYDAKDSNMRSSYEVVPMDDTVYTLVAQVAEEPFTLVPIDDVALPGKDFVILVAGRRAPADLIAERTVDAIDMMNLGAAGIFAVSCAYMIALLRGIRRMAWRAIILPGLWRGLLVAAPFAALYLHLRPASLVSVLIYAAGASFALALLLWWRASDLPRSPQQRASQTVTR
jgi:hypothetical protein